MSETEKTAEVGTGKADVDGSEMKLFESPVDLPKKVVVVDGKLGKEIGFVEREKVTELLANDPRYEGFEDGVTGKFMLSYSSDGARTKVVSLETEEVVKFLETVEANLDTAIAADDPSALRLGVSYERKGRAYVLSIDLDAFKQARPYLSTSIVKALDDSGEPEGDSEVHVEPTERLIRMFKERTGWVSKEAE